MAKTQKNKNTANHLGLLKARLAKLRRELITPKGSGGGPAGEGVNKIILFTLLVLQGRSKKLIKLWLALVCKIFILPKSFFCSQKDYLSIVHIFEIEGAIKAYTDWT